MNEPAAQPVAERLAAVRARIVQACHDAGRAPREVQLVAVSKRHGIPAIRAAYDAGQREFGENYAQELADKCAALADLRDLRFRFIGAFQRNKAKLLVPNAHVIETLSSVEGARAVSARSVAAGVETRVLLQVNVSREAQKSGVSPEQLGALVDAVRALPQLRLEGLMAIPEASDSARARASYALLRALRDEHGLRELSMGMSDDLEIAIAEGATSVRVGTAIFGARG